MAATPIPPLYTNAKLHANFLVDLQRELHEYHALARRFVAGLKKSGHVVYHYANIEGLLPSEFVSTPSISVGILWGQRWQLCRG
jgi:hypothetical protein